MRPQGKLIPLVLLPYFILPRGSVKANHICFRIGQTAGAVDRVHVKLLCGSTGALGRLSGFYRSSEIGIFRNERASGDGPDWINGFGEN